MPLPIDQVSTIIIPAEPKLGRVQQSILKMLMDGGEKTRREIFEGVKTKYQPSVNSALHALNRRGLVDYVSNRWKINEDGRLVIQDKDALFEGGCLESTTVD